PFRAALLHDVGKIGIPEQILRKQAPLDDGEWDVVKTHPVISDYILSELDLNPIVRQCARSSHERMDGLGYPDGLHGDEIPLPARIVLVADAFDALTSARPYRPARPPPAARAERHPHVLGARRRRRRAWSSARASSRRRRPGRGTRARRAGGSTSSSRPR